MGLRWGLKNNNGIPSVAKATLILGPFTERLKPLPFKTTIFQHHLKAVA